jgi:pyroglutamyl-peptidase
MIFVTAFDPFGKASVNGSREAALCWAALDPEITVAVLPVVRGLAWRVAQTTLAALPEPPKLWLMLGEAGREPQTVRLEKVAINWDDYRLPDNLGARPRDAAIVPGGPDAYFASLNVAKVADALEKKTPLPVQVSLSAGAFLCNHLSYCALHAQLPFPTAFVHVPAWRPEDGGEALGKLVATLRAVKETATALL